MRFTFKAVAVLAWVIATFWGIGLIATATTGEAAAPVVAGLLAAAFALGGRAAWRRADRARRPPTGAPVPLVPAPQRRARPTPPPVAATPVAAAPPATPPGVTLTAPAAPAAPPTPRTRTRRRSNRSTGGLYRVNLTRQPGTPAGDVVFSVIDLETTGMDPGSDRVIEVGIVKVAGDGTLLDEFATLVHAPHPVGSSRQVHHITDRDLIGAPTWGQVWPEVQQLVAGTILVAHHLDFEQGFLDAEVHRLGRAFPRTPGLCTLVQARRHLDGRAFSLKSLHKTVSGSWRNDDHTALGDARATRDLLLWLLHAGPEPLNLRGDLPPAATVGNPPASTPAVSRCPGWGTRTVADLVTALPDSPRPRHLDPAAAGAYRHQVDLALGDGRLTGPEAEHLATLACRLGATRGQIRRIHQDALDALAARGDTTAGRLAHLGVQLGLPRKSTVTRPGTVDPTTTVLRSWRIACVGDSPQLQQLRDRATRYGAHLAKNVTKTVRFTAADDPDSTAPALVTSRLHNIPIMTVTQATRYLDEALTAALREQRERGRQRAQDEQERQRRRAEADAYWRHSWRQVELPDDPGPTR